MLDAAAKTPAAAARASLCEAEWRAERRDALRACIAASISAAAVAKAVADGKRGTALLVDVDSPDPESRVGQDSAVAAGEAKDKGKEMGKGLGAAKPYSPFWIIPRVTEAR